MSFIWARMSLQTVFRHSQGFEANLVVLVAQQLTTARQLSNKLRLRFRSKIPVAFGGRIFNLHPNLPYHDFGPFPGI